MPTTRGTNNRVAAGLPLQTSNASDLPASSVNSLLANVPRTSSAIVPGSSAIPASAPDVPSPAFLASVVTAVREALAAEQAVTSSSLQAPVQPSSVAGAIGGVPPTFSDQSLQSQASMLAASGLGFSSPLCRSDRLLSRKVGQTLLYLLSCLPFLHRLSLRSLLPAAVFRVAARIFSSAAKAGDSDCFEQVCGI